MNPFNLTNTPCSSSSFSICVIFFDRNATKQQDFDGKRSGSSKNLKFDDIRFDKVFQDENCAAEGWC